MDKEDKQIIDRAVKEEWRIGDRTRLKRLLEKNLKLYRENVELEYENAKLKERYDKVDIIGYDALKQLAKAREIIKELKDGLSMYSGNYQGIILKAEQFLKEQQNGKVGKSCNNN